MKETEILVLMLLLTMVLVMWADRNRPIRIMVLFGGEDTKRSALPQVSEKADIPKHYGFCCP
jgi:hypothetical protein